MAARRSFAGFPQVRKRRPRTRTSYRVTIAALLPGNGRQEAKVNGWGGNPDVAFKRAKAAIKQREREVLEAIAWVKEKLQV